MWRRGCGNALDVGRHCAVAAQQSMPAEHPQIAGFRDRVRRRLRRIVGICPTLSPLGE